MRRLALLLPALLLLAMACAGTEHITSRDIVSRIPWTLPAPDHYRVLDRDDKEIGTADFQIEKSGEFIRLTQHYDVPDKGYVNDSVVIADPETLLPSSSSYTLTGPNGTLTCDAGYSAGQVSAHRVGQDEERTDLLDVPAIAYDSWADLFLWRTIDFSPGYETDYADVLSCTLDRLQKISVKLKVKGQERVTVPAGDYDVWRLEIDSGGETQTAWYSTDPLHVLVKYDNGSDTFELTAGDSAGRDRLNGRRRLRRLADRFTAHICYALDEDYECGKHRQDRPDHPQPAYFQRALLRPISDRE